MIDTFKADNQITEDDIENLIKKMDLNDDGKIDF